MIRLNKDNDILVIFGSTASNKSNIALHLAELLDGVIINADSSQIYKEAPILSNIPTETYNISHKLFSYLSICEESSVVQWLKLVKQEVFLAQNESKLPIIVGGSGMYISSLLYGISDIPNSTEHKNIATTIYHDMGHEMFLKMLSTVDHVFVQKFQDKQRIIRAYEVYLLTGKTLSYFQSLPKNHIVMGNFINVFINKDRPILYQNINDRFLKMIQRGAINEVQNILKFSQDKKFLKKIIGVYELSMFLQGNISLPSAIHLSQQITRHYAKRQLTWFKNQITTPYKTLDGNSDKNIIKNIFTY